MKIKPITVLFCTLCLLITACSMPVRPPTALPNQAIHLAVQRPANDTMYSVGETIPLEAAVYTSQPIRSHSFLANGIPVGTGMTDIIDAVFQASWTPGTAGEYYIQSKVTLMDGSVAISEPNRICVMTGALAGTFHPGNYTGLCEVPTRIPNPASSGVLVVNAVAVPDTIYFSELCPAYPSLTFIATVDDPQDLVAYVLLTLNDINFNVYNASFMSWVTTRPGNQKEYRRTIQLDSNFDFSANSSMPWIVSTIGRDGRDLTPVDGAIRILPLQTQCSQQPLVIPPSGTPAPLEILPGETPTPTAVVPLTFTLKKNAFCRLGPDMSLDAVTSFTAGETGDILNISEDGFWYFIHWKNVDTRCWVATGTGDANGDTTGLQVLAGPTLSAPEPGKPTRVPQPEPVLTDEPVVPPAPCNPLIRTCP